MPKYQIHTSNGFESTGLVAESDNLTTDKQRADWYAEATKDLPAGASTKVVTEGEDWWIDQSANTAKGEAENEAPQPIATETTQVAPPSQPPTAAVEENPPIPPETPDLSTPENVAQSGTVIQSPSSVVQENNDATKPVTAMQPPANEAAAKLLEDEPLVGRQGSNANEPVPKTKATEVPAEAKPLTFAEVQEIEKKRRIKALQDRQDDQDAITAAMNKIRKDKLANAQ